MKTKARWETGGGEQDGSKLATMLQNGDILIHLKDNLLEQSNHNCSKHEAVNIDVYEKASSAYCDGQDLSVINMKQN